MPAKKEKKGAAVCSVGVHHTGTDTIGGRYALALKECLNKSSLYRLADSPYDAVFRISLVSSDLATPGEQPGLLSGIALAYLQATGPGINDYFLTMVLQTVGRDRVESMAATGLANLDKLIEDNGLRSLCH